jgi:hypothetical protein
MALLDQMENQLRVQRGDIRTNLKAQWWMASCTMNLLKILKASQWDQAALSFIRKSELLLWMKL